MNTYHDYSQLKLSLINFFPDKTLWSSKYDYLLFVSFQEVNVICNTQYAICNMQYAICNMQYAICNMQ
jgi:hypothetical protein